MKIKVLILTIISIFVFGAPMRAISIDFYEVTESFFTTPKHYDIKSHCLLSLGIINGTTKYKKGEAEFDVKSNSFSINYNDGSWRGEVNNYSPVVKNVTVLGVNGDVVLPMIIYEDFYGSGYGIRAIKFEDGEYVVYKYIKNIPTGKYIEEEYFRLY